MKAQNKIFNFSIAAILVTTLFLPHFVFAEDVIEPTPVVIAPEAPVPEPMPEIPTPEPTTPEIPTSEVLTPEVPLEPIIETPVVEVPVVEIPVQEDIVIEVPLEPVLEPLISELSTPEIPAQESNTTTSTETITEERNQEPVVETLLAQPEPANYLTIRINDSIIYTGSYFATPGDFYSGATTTEIIDSTGATHTIDANSVLAMIVNADQASTAFEISNLQYYASLNSFLIKCITVNTVESCDNWHYAVDGSYPMVGAEKHILTDQNKVYLFFGEQTRFSLNNNTIQFDQPVIVHAEEYNYENNYWQPRKNITVGATIFDPANPWTPLVATSTLVNTDGIATLFMTATGTFNIGISEDYYYPTQPVTITVPQATFNLNIQTIDGTFYKSDVTITACTDPQTVYSLTAWCALQQVAEANNWTLDHTSGSDIFLNGINEYQTDFSTGKFWSWYLDLQLGETALNKYRVNNGEKLLLTFGINPIKLEVNDGDLFISGQTSVNADIVVSELNFSTWPAVWVPLTSSTLYINNEPIILASGTYSYTFTATTTLRAEKFGYISTDIRTVVLPTANTESTETNNNDTNTSSGSTDTSQNTVSTFNVNAAGNFLQTKQSSDGAIGSASLYSDWAAIAIGSLGNSSAKSGLVNYLKTDPAAGTTATDYERRAMALLALGINPYSGTPTNYIAEIMKKYDGTQFGDAGLVNDDIFALFPLLKSGYSINDVEIQKAVAFILSRQNGAGGWENPDLTAAAVQALSQVKSIGGVNDSLSRAKNYLKLNTKTDGRIGDNAFSTGWGLQALSALGESVSNWNGSNPGPVQYLASQQQIDGGVNISTDTSDNRIWATSYALPGVQGKTWDMILISVPKFTSHNSTGNSIDDDTSASTTSTTTQTVTSTPEIATSTTQFVTTTPEIISPTTTQTIVPETIPELTLETTEPTIELTEESIVDPGTRLANSGNKPKTTVSNPQQPNTGEQLSTPSASRDTAEAQKKALFGGAAALAGTAGAYLAWRFIQGLV